MKLLEDSCWPRRTKCEKILIALNCFVFLTVLITTVIIYIHIRKQDSVCFTPACTLAAARIIKTIDWTKNPCDDFFDMVCGLKLKSRTSIEIEKPSDYYESNVFFNRILLNALQDDSSPNLNVLFKLPRTFFKVCTDEDLRKTPYQEPRSYIKTILSDFNWLNATINARESGFPYNQFITIKIKTDPANGMKPIIVLEPAEFVNYLNQKHEFTNDSYIVYQKRELLGIYGFKEDINNVVKALNFGKLLMENRKPVPFKEMKSYSTTELNIKFVMEKFKWEKIIGTMIIKPLIFVSDENYLTNIQKLIKDADQNTTKIYMQIRLLEFANSVEELSNDITSECLKHTYGRFPIILSAMYFDRLSTENKNVVKQHLRALENIIDRVIRGVTWMDDETQLEAHKKWIHIKTSLGYDESMSDELKQYYSNLQLSDENYFENFVKVNQYNMRYWIEVFNSNNIYQSRLFVPNYHVDGAGYIQENNEFVVGAQFLQDVHYDKNRPEYMNFGAFGARVSQYLVHGFDNIGRHYDHRGIDNQWWSYYTENEFEKRATCIENQYNKFKYYGKNTTIDGYFTRDKNLADASAVDIAYYSYIGWIRMYGDSKNLPGLNLPNVKLFWIAYASSFCQKFEYDPFEHLINTENIVPPKFRVNGALRNSHNFHNDFKCKKGTNMHGDSVCQLYTVEPWFFIEE